MAEFHSGRIDADSYRQRRDATTAEQLALLTADPAFAAWQLKKAARDNRARVASNALAVAGCLLLVVTMALLKPAAVGQGSTPDISTSAPPPIHVSDSLPFYLSDQKVLALQHAANYRLESVQQESEVALDAIIDLALQLRTAEKAREAAVARLAAVEAEQVEKALAAGQSQRGEASRLIADMAEQLDRMTEEVAAAEASAEATAVLAEAAVAASEVLGMAPQAPLPTFCPALAAFAANPRMGPLDFYASEFYSNASSVVPATHINSLARTSLAGPPAALYTFLAAMACGSLALVVWLRAIRAAASTARRAAELSARLKEASFARDTAEQSLALLETELQRRMKQLEEVQQRAAESASPRIGALPAQHTPGKGELPPPPASLVEKFLRDHNFLAVQQEQMQEWLEMEQQFGELQAALVEKEAQLEALEQEFSAVNKHSDHEVRALEDHLSQVRSWLDDAQEELQHTQAALQEREAECRRVTAQLEAMAAMATDVQENEGREAVLLQQNLELVAQLQKVTAAYEEMRAQLSASSTATSAPAFAASGAGNRPASAASTLPGTPTADLTREVQSCLEMMRATRVQLADRLAHSAGVCEAMIADCQMAHSKGEAAREAEVAGTDVGDHRQEPEAFGSPTVASPSNSEQAQVEAEEAHAVLGISRRHHNNLPQLNSPSPTKKVQGTSGVRSTSVSPTGSVDGSMRAAWEVAHAHVAEVRAQHTSWDLAGFVQALGYKIEGANGVPADRAEFLALKSAAEAALQAAATAAGTPGERAVAGAALQVLHDWDWPVHRINTPPPSPFWRMLGLQA